MSHSYWKANIQDLIMISGKEQISISYKFNTIYRQTTTNQLCSDVQVTVRHGPGRSNQNVILINTQLINVPVVISMYLRPRHEFTT